MPEKEKPKEKSRQSKIIRSRGDDNKSKLFKNFIREQDKNDLELIDSFIEHIPIPEGWNVEFHLDDLHPAIWLVRSENGSGINPEEENDDAGAESKPEKIIMIYAAMNKVIMMLGEFKRIGKGESDFTMITPLLPPDNIPFMEEEGDEDADPTEKDISQLVSDMTERMVYILDWIEKKEHVEEDSKEDSKVEDGAEGSRN